ncbi:MAG: flagellar basal body rod protein FlgB [Oscillospiraceae bacterium]
MLFDNHSTQAAQASLDALWLKTQVISNNMANVDTPGFKAKQVSFAEVLDEAQRNGDPQHRQQQNFLQQQGGQKVLQGPVFNTRISTATNSDVRIDGNNVVLEEEQAELWKTYAQYSYLLDRISGHYSAINTAITNMKT